MTYFSRRTFITSSMLGAASLATPRMLAAQAAMSDTDFVRAALEAIHPGLFRYQTPAEFAANHAAFAQGFTGASFDDKVLALQGFLADVKCGHTYINPANQTEAIKQRLYSNRRLLPFHFRWIGDAMVVTEDAYDAGLPPGTIIEKINAWPAKDVLSWLLPFARADGGNDGKRRALMSVSGDYGWTMFDLYFALQFNPGATVSIEAVTPDGEPVKRKLETISHEQRLAAGASTAGSDLEAPIWSSSDGNNGKTKIITMPTWVTYKTKWDWEGWLRSQLGGALMDGTTGLIFDLRGNEGGISIGEGMLPFLIRDPIDIPRPQELVRFREAPADLRGQFSTWDKGFYTIGKNGESVEGGLIEINRAKIQRIEPMPQTFKGKIAVLINADNSSATFLFAQQLRAAGVATLIGETTGGNQRGINGGAYFFTRLPESGIEFDLPLIGYYPKGARPDAGLEPDETVIQSAKDIAAGRDPVMIRALEVVA